MVNHNGCHRGLANYRLSSIFNKHSFTFVCSYTEIVPLVTGLRHGRALGGTADCIRTLVELACSDAVCRSRHAGTKGLPWPGNALPRESAKRDCLERRTAVIAECQRVLKPVGITTLRPIHKGNTEAEGSLRMCDSSVANSAIFMVCRPCAADAGAFWEGVEP